MFLKHNIPPAPHGPPSAAGDRLLRQCLALAVLLHIWLVLMFGNATGTARPGDGVWGRLNVTLVGNRDETGSAAPQLRPPLPELSGGPVGQAKQQRFGGSVRPMEDPARKTPRPTTPGAAELGNWRAERVESVAPVDRAEAPTAAAATTAVPAQAQVEASPPPLMMAAPAAQNAVTRARPAPMTGLSPSRALAPLPLEPLPLPQARVMVMEAAPASAIARAKAEAIGRVVPTPEQPDQPKQPQQPRQASRLNPAQLAPSPLPPVSPLPQFKPDSLPAPVASPLPVVTPAPVLDASPAQVAEPSSKQLTAPSELSRQVANEVRALAPTPPAQATALAPLPAKADAAVTVPGAVSAATPSSSHMSNAAAPSLLPAVTSPGSPEAGPRLGQDVATPASAAAKPPPLNLNLPRPRGGELSSRGSSGVLQLLPAPPERKSKLSEDMEKAAKEDCRKAYGESLGLLAVVPLALDAAKSNKGCRW
ncbi:hypothetical protein LNV09_21445 [Paucibacter sp. B2R-40]|uniref:hypothetical protein n=1 Tax=Paucibacter sp. B2R-40 TaxID=2893554 RepID=UPI0021E43B80|nr:hypothetical protein [Paucibacter sp. B2R-40]MCV2356713.1 hypothetical protein [Paucibacter sp. B2R-40]